MKVIDLLNKIANGEEVKFNIECQGEKIKYYYEKGKTLRYENDDDVEWFINEEWLNNEVEIIEEDKKIEKLREPLLQEETLNYVKLLKSKINEIIDYLDKGE